MLIKYFKNINSKIKQLSNQVLELETILDFIINDSEYVSSESCGFNGQVNRKQIFKEILDKLDVENIFETGTRFGYTTGFLASCFHNPIFSSEVKPRNYNLAQKILRNFNNITLELSDSRDFIKKYSKQKNLTKGIAFFYLDAHGSEDLPLLEELILIFDNWKNPIVMVDDFKVPFDKNYGYDSYGKNKVLSIDYIKKLVINKDLAIFFPSTPASKETGAKRGSIVLTKKADIAQKLESIRLLKKYNIR